MYLWIWVTIVAAISQSLRTAQQKNLQPVLGNFGASYVRFSYAIPFAWAWIIAYAYFFNVPFPVFNFSFFVWVTIAGITQIIFTVLLITLFSHRSFAAGTAFSKTEVIQAAIFEAIILGHIVNLKIGIAIVLGVIAVFLLSLVKSKLTLKNLFNSILTRQAALGLGSGAFLGFCTVAFRAATDSLESTDLIMRASITGGISVLIQSVIMGVWMIKYAQKEFFLTFVNWRGSSLVGLFGAITTACWFYAFSANAVAPVRALGQIELIIALFISIFFFKERPSSKELIAIFLLITSIIMVIIFN
jgi:drug/metabolite transporter (DMT)-like permease